LRFWNGYGWSTYATTTTNTNGEYLFTNLPLLSGSQVVYARWLNTMGDTNRLWTWNCNQISTESISREYTCYFDLKNIPLVSPASGSAVPLPQTFTWTPRGFSGENYEFDLYDINDPNLYFYAWPLGNVGSYALTSLPLGFATGSPYVWEIWTCTDYDGCGLSYDYWYVTFTSSGLAPLFRPAQRRQGWLTDGLPRQPVP
jgi:hypothetical protein